MAAAKKSAKDGYKAYESQKRQEANQAKCRARHAKRHPNDLQSKTEAVKGFKRKKPMKAGAFPAENRSKFYRDKSGKRLTAPAFKAADVKAATSA